MTENEIHDIEILKNEIQKFNKELLEQLSELKDRIERLEEYLSYNKDTPWLDYNDTSLSKRNSM